MLLAGLVTYEFQLILIDPHHNIGAPVSVILVTVLYISLRLFFFGGGLLFLS